MGRFAGSVSLRDFFDDRALESVMLGLLENLAGSRPLQLLALTSAVGIGALHALGPGHGKVLVGAYLASSRGQARDAAGIGGLVAAMHTGSVLVLGLAFAALQRFPWGDRLEGGLRLLSGVAVTAVGAWLLRHHLHRRHRRGPRSHPAPVPARGHGLERGHGHERRHVEPFRPEPAGHDHPPPVAFSPRSRAGVVALATSGGLVPSPAAFVMLASAIAIGRTGHGLVLVLAFSTGLAATLTAVGLSIVWGRGRLDRLGRRRPWLTRVAGALPVVAAAAVTGGGLVLTVAAALRW